MKRPLAGHIAFRGVSILLPLRKREVSRKDPKRKLHLLQRKEIEKKNDEENDLYTSVISLKIDFDR